MEHHRAELNVARLKAPLDHEDLASLKHVMFKSGHGSYLRRRREWFQPIDEAATVLWRVLAGTIPSIDEAHRRLALLRADGPTPEAWPLNSPSDPPGVPNPLETDAIEAG